MFVAKIGAETAIVTSGKKPLGHGSYEPHFHAILKQDTAKPVFCGICLFPQFDMSARGAVMRKTARKTVKFRNGEFREQ